MAPLVKDLNPYLRHPDRNSNVCLWIIVHNTHTGFKNGAKTSFSTGFGVSKGLKAESNDT